MKTNVMLTCVFVLAALATVSLARADFIENFDSYPLGNGNLGAPWVGGFQFGVLGDISEQGFNSSHGFHSDGPDWNDGDRASNYDTGVLQYELSWKARLTSANGTPRLTGGVGNASGGTALLWEYRGIIVPGSNFRTGVLEGPPGSTLVPINGRDVWQEITITLKNDGANNWTWSGRLANEADNFASSSSIGDNIAIPAGFLPQSVHLQSIFAFDEPAGESALDDVRFTSVPEPSTVALLGLCGLIAMIRGRRRR